jgi:hypothetical protein
LNFSIVAASRVISGRMDFVPIFETVQFPFLERIEFFMSACVDFFCKIGLPELRRQSKTGKASDLV